MTELNLLPGVGKMPPMNPAEELAIIASLLDNPGKLEEAASLLVGGQAFYYELNRTILTTMLALLEAGKKIRPLTILQHLEQNPVPHAPDSHVEEVRRRLLGLHKRPGETYGIDLMDHCLHCRELWVRRELLGASGQLQRQAYDLSVPLSELMATATAIGDDMTRSITLSETEAFAGKIDEYMDWFCAPKPASGLSGIGSGLATIDSLTGGWQKSDVIFIAARPAMGKSLIANKIAKEAVLAGEPTGIVSFEMPSIGLINRWIAEETGIEYGNLEKFRHRLSVKEANLVHQAAARLRGLPIYVYPHDGSWDLADVMAWIKDIVRRYGVKLIIIDYIQQITCRELGPKANEQTRNAFISQSIKQLQHRLQIPFICMAQLNRGPEDEEDHRPQMKHLRSSGQYEQDGSVVIMLFRPDYYEAEQEAREQSKSAGGWVVPKLTKKLEWIVVKNRNGPPTTVRNFLDVRTGQVEDNDIQFWRWLPVNLEILNITKADPDAVADLPEGKTIITKNYYEPRDDETPF